MYCLWCMAEKQIVFNWSNFLRLEKAVGLCEDCKEHLQLLKGKRCKLCSRETGAEVCSDCNWWRNQTLEDPLIKNYSIFHYNSFMQDVIVKWKYRGDYILGEIFKPYLYKYFKKKFKSISKDTVIVPIPLSQERLNERGFNQAKTLANFLPAKQRDILVRKHGEKQAKKGRKERIQTENPFTLLETIQKPVILVDDIYTTGTTLRHAAQLLKENDCPEIYAYTLIRG